MNGERGLTPLHSRRLLIVAVAAVAVIAVVIGVIAFGIPGLSPSPAAADMGSTEISGTEPVESDGPSGVDVELPAGTTEVRVAAAEAPLTALARATVDPAADVELSAEGSTFLTAAGGTGTISATSFFPVRDGIITVESSSPVSLHLEILALFDGDSDTAGSLRLLPAPVQVIDTASGIGSDDLSTPMDVYVNGYAAPQGTPHLLARVTGTFEEPTSVTMSEQEVRFPAGSSTTTTVLSTVEDVITLSAESHGDLRVDIIGHMTAAAGTAPLGSEGESTTAGAVMGLSSQAAQSLALTEGSPADVDLGDLRATSVIGLLSPDSGAPGTITSTYDENAHHRGTAVTADVERAGELVIVAGDAPQLSADVDVRADFLPVAIVQPHEIVTGEDVSVTIDTFPELEVDAAHGVLRFAGTFRAPHRIAAISVEVDGRQVTPTAPLSLDGNGGAWHQDIIPAESGPLEVAVTAVDVSGDTATATWNGTVTVPGNDDVVISPQARILTPEELAGMTEESAAVLSSDDAPAHTIGDVLVAGASDGLPDGTLGQVLAIRYEQGRWLTVLGPASLGNVILQGEFDLVLDRTDSGDIVQRDLDGDEQELTTLSTGGGAVGGAFILPLLPRMDGSAGEPRELSTDSTYDLVSHTCEDDLASIPLASEEAEATSADGLWAMSGSAQLDASVTCEAKLGLRITYSAEYKPDGVIAVGLDAVQLMNTVQILEDEAAQTLEGVLTTAGSLFESDWTMSASLLGTAEVAVALTGSAKGEIATVDDALEKHVPLARATFFLGPVPVTLDGDVTLTPSIALDAEGEFELSTAFSGSLESGLTLERSTGITPLHSLNTELSTEVSGVASATATAALTVEPTLTLYKTMSLSLTARPTAEAMAKGEFSASDGSSFALTDQDAVTARAGTDALSLATHGRRFLDLEGSFTIGLDLKRELAAFPHILAVLEGAGVSLEVTLLDTTFATSTFAEKTLWEYSYPADVDPESFEPEMPELDVSGDGAEILSELAGKSFVFSSGAGAWSTGYEMGADGTFTGEFSDSDMGAGIRHSAQFEGRLEVGERIDETTYALNLVEFTRTTPPSGQVEEDGYTIQYEPSVYGFDQCRDFRLLFPDTPTSSLNDDQRLWSTAAQEGPTLTIFSITCFEEDRQEDIMHGEVIW
ncbi:MAG: hypothetical protein ACTH0H_10880 [Brachybacterium sp.]